jgi:hypothetical protein
MDLQAKELELIKLVVNIDNESVIVKVFVLFSKLLANQNPGERPLDPESIRDAQRNACYKAVWEQICFLFKHSTRSLFCRIFIKWPTTFCSHTSRSPLFALYLISRFHFSIALDTNIPVLCEKMS